jgi:hypothetical protein
VDTTNLQVPATLTTPVSFEWNDRTWKSSTEAMSPMEMRIYLGARFISMQMEECYNLAMNGGTFDVTYGKFFRTYYVHKQSGGLLRLFRAVDTRELRNGATWLCRYSRSRQHCISGLHVIR